MRSRIPKGLSTISRARCDAMKSTEQRVEDLLEKVCSKIVVDYGKLSRNVVVVEKRRTRKKVEKDLYRSGGERVELARKKKEQTRKERARPLVLAVGRGIESEVLLTRVLCCEPEE
jgi:hypothetical protein